MKKSKVQSISVAGMLLALGILLPLVTAHGFCIPGVVLLPMHIPVLLCGFICGPLYGGVLGFVLPLLNSVLTGMPVMYPMAFIMMMELMTYGIVSGFLYHKIGMEKKRGGLYLSLVIAMLSGRVMYGLTFQILFAINCKMKAATVWVAITTGIPGILIQLILIPTMVVLLNKRVHRKMNKIINFATSMINDEQAACVVIKNGKVIDSEAGRGVKPIIALSKRSVLSDALVVDKVVGKAAAMVMTYSGVKYCHAITISEFARDWFEKYDVEVTYEKCVPYIVNRAGDGMCPMEDTVQNIEDHDGIIEVLETRLAEL